MEHTCYECAETKQCMVHGYKENRHESKHWEWLCEDCHLKIHPEFGIPVNKHDELS